MTILRYCCVFGIGIFVGIIAKPLDCGVCVAAVGILVLMIIIGVTLVAKQDRDGDY